MKTLTQSNIRTNSTIQKKDKEKARFGKGIAPQIKYEE